MKTYIRVYFSLCLFLAISERSRTQRKLNLRERFPIYGISCVVSRIPFCFSHFRSSQLCCNPYSFRLTRLMRRSQLCGHIPFVHTLEKEHLVFFCDRIPFNLFYTIEKEISAVW